MMKKLLLTALALVLALSMVACGGETEGPPAGDELAAKTYTQSKDYMPGDVFTLKVDEYFEHTTDKTTYTADKGTIADKMLTLDLIAGGDVVVKVTASDSGKTAVLTVNLKVATYKELADLNKTRAVSYGKLINANYWDSETQLSTSVPNLGAPFLWPYTEQVAMCNAILPLLDETTEKADYDFFKKYLEETLEGLRYYRVSKADGYTTVDYGTRAANGNSYAIYNSGRNHNKKDSAGTDKYGIYFDDNIWVVKEFYEAYQNLGDQKYLNECLNVLDWIVGEGLETAISSEGKFKGVKMSGVYWKWGVKNTYTAGDPSKEHDDGTVASLNACSSAPTAMMLAKVSKILTDPQYAALQKSYVTKANEIFLFNLTVLKNDDGLYQDKVFVKQGKGADKPIYLELVDSQILGYNTGCMITAGIEINSIKASSIVLNATLKTIAFSDFYFAKPNQDGICAYNKNSWFTSFLLEGYIDGYAHDEKIAEYIGHFSTTLDYAWKTNKDEKGFVSPSWVIGWSDYPSQSTGEDSGTQILLQSANAHCYAMLASHYATLA